MEHNIGFVGLGAMGYAMAMNVRKYMDAKSTMYVYDVHRPSCERFKTEFSKFGPIEIADSAKTVAENALAIVSIVPTGKSVKDVYLDEPTGIIAARGTKNGNLDASRLYLECSTIDVATAKEIGATLKNVGMGTYIDSPVSGGVPAAEQGSLSFLLGTTQPDVHDAEIYPLKERMQTISGYMGAAEKTFFCGALGNGLAAKICNNYLSCTILLANCEAMATGMRLGLDKHLLHQIIQNSSGQNFMADHVCPVPGVVAHAPSSNNYKLGFKSQMLVKDVGLGVDAARSVDIKPTIGEAAMKVYEKVAVDERFIDRDGSIVYRYLGGPEN
ncbi:6-phosphogluconate dehydrogenase [Ilyonectria sp. MPI-CAGE-AT-0026]|nr:6-phosphogluconate dehydrogenase [Ilyonectria sp. MPI-CAGE-AT-0026]